MEAESDVRIQGISSINPNRNAFGQDFHGLSWREETCFKEIVERRSSNEEITMGDGCRMSIRGS